MRLLLILALTIAPSWADKSQDTSENDVEEAVSNLVNGVNGQQNSFVRTEGILNSLKGLWDGRSENNYSYKKNNVQIWSQKISVSQLTRSNFTAEHKRENNNHEQLYSIKSLLEANGDVAFSVVDLETSKFFPANESKWKIATRAVAVVLRLLNGDSLTINTHTIKFAHGSDFQKNKDLYQNGERHCVKWDWNRGKLEWIQLCEVIKVTPTETVCVCSTGEKRLRPVAVAISPKPKATVTENIPSVDGQTDSQPEKPSVTGNNPPVNYSDSGKIKVNKDKKPDLPVFTLSDLSDGPILDGIQSSALKIVHENATEIGDLKQCEMFQLVFSDTVDGADVRVFGGKIAVIALLQLPELSMEAFTFPQGQSSAVELRLSQDFLKLFMFRTPVEIAIAVIDRAAINLLASLQPTQSLASDIISFTIRGGNQTTENSGRANFQIDIPLTGNQRVKNPRCFWLNGKHEISDEEKCESEQLKPRIITCSCAKIHGNLVIIDSHSHEPQGIRSSKEDPPQEIMPKVENVSSERSKVLKNDRTGTKSERSITKISKVIAALSILPLVACAVVLGAIYFLDDDFCKDLKKQLMIANNCSLNSFACAVAGGCILLSAFFCARLDHHKRNLGFLGLMFMKASAFWLCALAYQRKQLAFSMANSHPARMWFMYLICYGFSLIITLAVWAFTKEQNTALPQFLVTLCLTLISAGVIAYAVFLLVKSSKCCDPRSDPTYVTTVDSEAASTSSNSVKDTYSDVPELAPMFVLVFGFAFLWVTLSVVYYLATIKAFEVAFIAAYVYLVSVFTAVFLKGKNYHRFKIIVHRGLHGSHVRSRTISECARENDEKELKSVNKTYQQACLAMGDAEPCDIGQEATEV